MPARSAAPSSEPARTGICSTRTCCAGSSCGGTESGADLALLRNLGEVRGIIEPAAVRLAAERRTEADLATLEAAITAMGEQEGGPAHAVEADLAFHRALLAATHNELLERLEMVIESGLAHRDEIVHSSQAGEDPVPSHRAVLDAVRDRDPAAAEHAMRALLDQAVRDLHRVHGTAPGTEGAPGTGEGAASVTREGTEDASATGEGTESASATGEGTVNR